MSGLGPPWLAESRWCVSLRASCRSSARSSRVGSRRSRAGGRRRGAFRLRAAGCRNYGDSCRVVRGGFAWAYYQAKAIRRTTNEVAAQLAQSLSTGESSATKAIDGFNQTARRYEREAADIQKQAEELEHDRDRQARLANHFDLAEIFFELALVTSSVAILTKRRAIWLGSLAAAAVGLVVALSVLPLL